MRIGNRISKRKRQAGEECTNVKRNTQPQRKIKITKIVIGSASLVALRNSVRMSKKVYSMISGN